MMRKISACVSLLMLLSAPAVADEVPSPDWNPFFRTEPAQDFKWRRPPEVSYVLISACGGGASGSGNSPGHSAPINTIVIPVTADVYTIRIGRGGDIAERYPNTPAPGTGEVTSFVGTDRNITFPGAGAGPLQSASAGEGSLFGPGAANGKFGAADASIAPPEGHYCVGGAGGIPMYQFDNKNFKKAGNGHSGFLALYPLPDVQRLANLIEALNPLAVQPPVGTTAEAQ